MTSPSAQADIDLFHAISNTTEGNRFSEQERDVVRDPRTGRIITEGLRDDALVVRFTTDKIFSKIETYKNGGEPTYVDRDFITITIPGDRDLTVHSPVTDYYQWRFPQEFAAFKTGQEGIVNGTPLSAWSQITPSQANELSFHGITTVEQIANLGDGASGVLRAFHKMKALAKVFLEQRAKAEAGADIEAIINERDARHAADMASMQAKLDALMALLEQKPATTKTK